MVLRLAALALLLGACSHGPLATPQECDDACRHLVQLNFRKSGLTQAQCGGICTDQRFTTKDVACINESQQIDEGEMCLMRAKARYEHRGLW